MPTSREELQSDETCPGGLRNHLLVAGLLLTLTIGGGVAARIVGEDVPPLGGSTLFSAGATGPVHFGAQLDRSSVMVGGDGVVRMELVVRGEKLASSSATRVPTDLFVVLDRSGSMDGSAMQHALAAVRELIGELSIDDRFTLITYASGANELISLAHATPSARRAWTSTLDHVRAGGGTNMASGIDLATAAVDRTRAKGRVPRIILLSDGHANEGDSSRAGLLARAGRAAAGEYVLSAVGVADGFDESLMTALADAGTGNFYYVQRSEELGEVFAAEFASARETIASALEVSIDPAPGIEVVSAAGYPLDRQDRRVSFRPGALFSGQERRIWLTLRLPVTNVEVGPEDSLPLGAFSLSFIHGGERHTLRLAEEPRVARVQDEDAYFESVELSRWERSVEEEEVGELKLSVSKDIERGDRPGAMRKLGAFLSRQKAMNRRMQSPKVEEVISSVGEMALDVAGAFEADDAKMKLLLRKTYSAEGYDDRRPGAKY